ncbi:MAG: hypothetical protein MRY32_06440 [Rickettsiales bacterium]|nr:hypothetical protein [Rickettsiales bacterium]
MSKIDDQHVIEILKDSKYEYGQQPSQAAETAKMELAKRVAEGDLTIKSIDERFRPAFVSRYALEQEGLGRTPVSADSKEAQDKWPDGALKGNHYIRGADDGWTNLLIDEINSKVTQLKTEKELGNDLSVIENGVKDRNWYGEEGEKLKASLDTVAGKILDGKLSKDMVEKVLGERFGKSDRDSLDMFRNELGSALDRVGKARTAAEEIGKQASLDPIDLTETQAAMQKAASVTSNKASPEPNGASLV